MTAAEKNTRDWFSLQVGEQEARKLKARREHKRSPWMGFGLFGIVGWSVALPTVAGAALGRWLDLHYPQTFSWTLTCLVAGLLAGCVIAGHWIRKEQDEMHRNREGRS